MNAQSQTPTAKIVACFISALLASAPESFADNEGKHLFILSGQSNMARLDPSDSFTPTVIKEFGSDNVIVVKDAKGGQPIRRWYKNWKPAKGAASTPSAKAEKPAQPSARQTRQKAAETPAGDRKTRAADEFADDLTISSRINSIALPRIRWRQTTLPATGTTPNDSTS